MEQKVTAPSFFSLSRLRERVGVRADGSGDIQRGSHRPLLPSPLPSPASGRGRKSDLETMVAISPHLDDAVLSCGQLLAARPGSVVITVFAGMPRDGSQQTDWDRRCGFAN